MAGLSSAGFERKRLDQITGDIFDRLDQLVWANGKAGPVSRSPDTVIGAFVNVVAFELAVAWETLEATYYSKYPATATGTSLDNAVSYSAIRRKGARATSVIVTCYGVADTAIPAGSIVSDVDAVNQYQSTTHGVIDANTLIDTEFDVTIIDSTTYTLIVNGQAESVTTSSVASVAELCGLFAAALPDLVVPIRSDKLQLKSPDGVRTFMASSADANLVQDVYGVGIQFWNLVTGPIECAAGSVDTIKTPVFGWVSCRNVAAGVAGQDAETDEELRWRYTQSVFTPGAGHLMSIRGEVLSVPGVMYCTALENVEDTVSPDGLVPHSIEMIVSGGADADVADAIWRKTAAGIDTNGTTVVPVPDGNGGLVDIKFSRPVPVPITLDIEVSMYGEEQFPATGLNDIALAALEHGQTLGVGVDVIVQRFYGPIYAAVSGIGSITVKVNGATGNLPIGVHEIADFDLSRITVAVV